jgi:hypothetical protein
VKFWLKQLKKPTKMDDIVKNIVKETTVLKRPNRTQ